MVRRILRRRLHPAAAYAAAVVLAASAIPAALVLRPWLDPNMTLPFIGAVALASCIGGWGPGLLTIAIGTFGFYYLFIPPEREVLAVGITGITRTAAFLAVNVLIVGLIETIRKEHNAVLESDKRLRQQAEELARSNAELEQFAYVASHDLQEPLRMVASYTELLGERYRGRLDADADEFISYATGGARRMQELINALLLYSRTGRRELALGSVPSADALRDALRNLEAAVNESGASISAGDLPEVTADRVQLVQLFQNLLGNAIKFRGAEPPRVHVAASREGDSWNFSVRDNGIGIDARHANRVFTMFQRLHSRDRYPGAGIGLALCRKIVERHGGRIWVEPQPRGTVFRFTLPIRNGFHDK